MTAARTKKSWLVEIPVELPPWGGGLARGFFFDQKCPKITKNAHFRHFLIFFGNQPKNAGQTLLQRGTLRTAPEEIFFQVEGTRGLPLGWGSSRWLFSSVLQVPRRSLSKSLAALHWNVALAAAGAPLRATTLALELLQTKTVLPPEWQPALRPGPRGTEMECGGRQGRTVEHATPRWTTPPPRTTPSGCAFLLCVQEQNGFQGGPMPRYTPCNPKQLSTVIRGRGFPMLVGKEPATQYFPTRSCKLTGLCSFLPVMITFQYTSFQVCTFCR